MGFLDTIKDTVVKFLAGTLGEELCVFFCSMLPIIELRGSIPIGALLFKTPWWQNFLLSWLGNMVPVPFILLFINKIIGWMATCKIKFFNKVANWLLNKVEKKRSKVEKYAFWGLVLFVAIPAPGTGAWTGSLIAATIKMDPWKSLCCVAFGVTLAAIVVTLISYVFTGLLFLIGA